MYLHAIYRILRDFLDNQGSQQSAETPAPKSSWLPGEPLFDSMSSAEIRLAHKTNTRIVRKSDHILDLSQLRAPRPQVLALIMSLHQTAEQNGHQLSLTNASSEVQALLQKMPLRAPKPVSGKGIRGVAEAIGAGLYSLRDEVVSLLFLMSESLYWNSFGLLRKKTLLPGSMIQQMIRLGSSALPIVVMLSFLIGLTLAFQSAVQLEKFGASIYMVSGLAISMVTEIGPLMTAIILAGRSGASVTAEISSMVVQEEIKALRMMAINPVQFLVLPRFRALTLAGPMLTVFSIFAGFTAGFLIAFFYLNIPVPLFFAELQNALSLNFVGQSMIKALVFSWIIILVACNKGLNVSGGADSVGRATTETVVFSISAIILADAVFSFIFYW